MPVFIAKELAQYDVEAIVLSRSNKLLGFAKQQDIKHIKTWWWAQQNWSGWRALLFPIYVLWQIILFLYYLILFIYLHPSVVSPQSKDDFISVTFAARVLGIKVFWVDHGDLKAIWANHGIWYKNPTGKLVYLASHATRLIVVASKNEQGLISNNLPKSQVNRKFRVIYNGSFDFYKQAEKKIDFISTARLVTDKGIKELIEAFTRVVEKYPTATLAIIGDGPEHKKFKKQAKNVSGITFYGHQSEPLDFLRKSKIFILPTYHEAFGVAVVEACMEGLAIIATDIGGIPEIIDDGKNGLLVPIKDSEALFEAMNHLYKNPELQHSLGEAARLKFLNNFQLGKIIKRDYLPLYRGKI